MGNFDGVQEKKRVASEQIASQSYNFRLQGIALMSCKIKYCEAQRRI